MRISSRFSAAKRISSSVRARRNSRLPTSSPAETLSWRARSSASAANARSWNSASLSG